MELTIATSEDMRAFGRTLAAQLRPGDLVLLHGGLGAGKTTLTKGIGQGLRVAGTVASPTFVIARTHRPSDDGPGLVHVDAYRLGGMDELDALDLDASLDDSVTVVEWGEGIAEILAEDRLEIVIERPRGAGDGDPMADEPRHLTITAHGDRWDGQLRGLSGVPSTESTP